MTRESIIQLSEDLSNAKFVSSLEEAIAYTQEAMPEWGYQEMVSLVTRHATSVRFPCLVCFDYDVGVPIFVSTASVRSLQNVLLSLLPGDPIAKAMQVAGREHADQKDKGGNAYSKHALAVAYAVMAGGGSDATIAAALMHDIVEDTTVSTEDLRRKVGFSDAIVDAVDAVPRRPEETVDQYLGRLALNKDAVVIKRADVRHNMDLSRLNREPTDKDLRNHQIYVNELMWLGEGSNE